MNVFRYTPLATTFGLVFAGAAVAQTSFQSSQHGQRAQQEMLQRDQRLTREEAASDPRLIGAWTAIDVT